MGRADANADERRHTRALGLVRRARGVAAARAPMRGEVADWAPARLVSTPGATMTRSAATRDRWSPARCGAQTRSSPLTPEGKVWAERPRRVQLVHGRTGRGGVCAHQAPVSRLQAARAAQAHRQGAHGCTPGSGARELLAASRRSREYALVRRGFCAGAGPVIQNGGRLARLRRDLLVLVVETPHVLRVLLVRAHDLVELRRAVHLARNVLAIHRLRSTHAHAFTMSAPWSATWSLHTLQTYRCALSAPSKTS